MSEVMCVSEFVIKVDRKKIEKCFMVLQYAEHISPSTAQYFRVFTVFYNSTAAHYPFLYKVIIYNRVVRYTYTSPAYMHL